MKRIVLFLLIGWSAAAVSTGADQGLVCKYCGTLARNARALLSAPCPKHPAGFAKGRHALFEGEARSVYTCVHCGQTAGFAKGKHSPAR